ncbi:MAG: hypothetical protein Kow0065_09040 [Methylomicrobium sp.]
MNSFNNEPCLLVVDDDPVIRLLVCESLACHGFAIEQADCGERALTIFNEVRPDIILLDINMPGIDGIETCRRIRALPQGQWVPILILTASEDTRSINDAYQAGATDFITKPINWPVLIHHVRYMLRAGQAIIDQHNDVQMQQLAAALSELYGQNFNSMVAMTERAMSVLISDRLMTTCCKSCAIYLRNGDELIFAVDSEPGLSEYPRVIAVRENVALWGEGALVLQPLAVSGVLHGALLFQFDDHCCPPPMADKLLGIVAEKIAQLIVRIQAELETRLAAEVFENSFDGIAITDAEGTLLRVNRVFEQITGYALQEVLGKNIGILKSGKQDKLFYRSFWEGLLKTGKWQGEIWNRRKNGEIYPEWLSVSAIRGADGKVCQYIAVFSDISKQKEQEKRIRTLAYYDDLTGLANRTLLNDHLQLALAQSDRTFDSVALLFIDLDRFKNINDTLGHSVGDRLLAVVAERLKGMFRNADTVARQGGDEFIVLLTNLPRDKEAAEQHALRVAEHVRKNILAPIHLVPHELTVSGSIGIAFYPHDASTGSDLIKHADTAMYAAKEKGRNRFKLFHPSMAEKERQRFTMETLLKKALENGEFELYCQPQYDIETMTIIGGECLLRWTNEKLGMVSPMEFIPLAEETGLIQDIGAWVLATACAKLSHWERSGSATRRSCRYLAVNVSPLQFARKDFVQRLKKIILSSGLNDLSMLELELTEGCLMHHSFESIKTLIQLRGMGVRISIDDFGTGYSNLSYLRHFSLDTLKIDQSFVRDCIDDDSTRAIVKAIISMSDGLGLSTIAEGIENKEQLHYLNNLGCRVFQGYLFSKPIPMGEFEALLETGIPLDRIQNA